MRRPLAIAFASAALLSGCALAPKLPAIPPPDEGATPAPSNLQPAPTAWYQPFSTDGSMEEKRFGLGFLKAKYGLMDKTSSVKTKKDLTTAAGPTLQVAPLSADLMAAFFTAGMPYFGFGWGDSSLDIAGMGPTPVKIPIKMYGLYEGVRVPITIADFKKPDIQLLLVPGFTAQVLYMTGSDAGYKATGLVIGGSLNGLGFGVAVGDWLVVEADLVKWGWSYMVDMTVDQPSGGSLAGSFSGFSYGFAPVFYTRVMF